MLTRDRRPTVPAQQSYSGAWRNATTFSDRALPPAPGVDPSHMKPEDPDPGTVVAGYPRVDYAPLYLTQNPDDAYAFELDTPGLVLDTEPRAHDVGDPDVTHPAPIPGAQSDSPDMAAHALDRGGQLLQIYADPSLRAADERPVTERWENKPVTAGSTVAALRGTNALPENNPDGFRDGWLVKRYYHREMPHEYVKHTERALHPAGAASAVVSPAMSPQNSNRYTSPFAWRSFYGTRNWQRPIMRRNPPDSWDDQTEDGQSETSDVPGDWVIG
jgi:hypothetical protein